jgi:hypothetical protein
MTSDEFESELPEFEKSLAEPDKWRICSMCLCEVDRSKYTEHMQSHGYEVMNVYS